MGLIHYIFHGQEGDALDTVLSVGHFFNWWELFANAAQGYNNRVYSSDSFASCVAVREKLKQEGTSARVEGSPLSGYWVVTQ